MTFKSSESNCSALFPRSLELFKGPTPPPIYLFRTFISRVSFLQTGQHDSCAVAKRWRLQIGLDYGTKNNSVAIRIAEDGEEHERDVHEILFSGRNYTPQQIVWRSNHLFLWGWEVDEAFDQGLIEAEDIIEYWKLLLYEDHKSSPIAEEVKARLKGRNITDLISKHLSEIIKYVRKQVASDHNIFPVEKEVKRMPIDLFLSVPLMWHPDACLTMTNAAEKAGIPKSNLVFEPQCIAATFALKAQNDFELRLKVGDVVVIIDIGGGTADAVAYKVLSITGRGAKVDFQAVGNPQGSLCGSEFVNRNFIAWLKQQTPDLEARCANLGRSCPDVLREVCKEFERAKCSFRGQYRQTSSVTILGNNGAALPYWVIPIPCDVMKSFFDPVIAEIKELIDTQLDKKTKALLVPGGFGMSAYLMDELRRYYSYRKDLKIIERGAITLGDRQPVSCGALHRYHEISLQGLPATASFGIAQEEEYDPAIHTDAVLPHQDGKESDEHSVQTDLRSGEHESTLNVITVDEDELDGVKFVRERWCQILKKGVTASPDQEFTTETWQQFAVAEDQKSVSIQIYWTQLDIQEHERIRIGKDATTRLKPGIYKWNEPVKVKVGDLKEAGHALVEAHNGEMVFQIQVQLKLTCDGANVKVAFEIKEPDLGGYDMNGIRRVGPARMMRTRNCRRVIWDQDHNPSVRDSAS